MYGDFLFKTPTNNLARALASEPEPPIFFYHFTHQVFYFGLVLSFVVFVVLDVVLRRILILAHSSFFTSLLTRAPCPSTTVSTSPLSSFFSNSLVFASGLTGFGQKPLWTGFVGLFIQMVFLCKFYIVKPMYKMNVRHTGPMTECVMRMSCSCCSRLIKCQSRWCAVRLTRG